jgi:hypothetical protein
MTRFDPLQHLPEAPAVIPAQLASERRSMHEVRDGVGRFERNAALKLDMAGLGPIWHGFVDRIAKTPGERSELHAQLNHVLRAASAQNKQAKARAKSPRPFQLDSTLDVFGAPPPGSSHPSGHATIAFAAAGFLGRVAPERRAELLSAAANVARSRVVLGVHYPGDVAVGARYGLALGEQRFHGA